MIIERGVARVELFELLIGPIHACMLLSPNGLKGLRTATIVDAVLNGIAKAD